MEKKLIEETDETMPVGLPCLFAKILLVHTCPVLAGHRAFATLVCGRQAQERFYIVNTYMCIAKRIQRE